MKGRKGVDETPEKKTESLELIKNMTYNINRLRMEIKTKGENSPLTVIEIKDVSIETTDSKFQVS